MHFLHRYQPRLPQADIGTIGGRMIGYKHAMCSFVGNDQLLCRQNDVAAGHQRTGWICAV
jgi:hypothetical protein